MLSDETKEGLRAYYEKTKFDESEDLGVFWCIGALAIGLLCLFVGFTLLSMLVYCCWKVLKFIYT